MTRFDAMDYRPGASYTVELGSLVSNGFDLGLDKYPIFDRDYREPLNAKIIEHYWFREIGAETPALFRRYLARKMNEIMPFYNEVYKTTLLDLDPLANVSMTTEGKSSGTNESERNAKHAETTEGKGSSETENDTMSRTLASETPQTQLSGYEDYASALNDSTGKATGTASTSESSSRNLTEDDTSRIKTLDEYVTKVTGLTGMTQAQAIMDFRAQLLNVDMLIIEELAPLFMGVWNPYANVL